MEDGDLITVMRNRERLRTTTPRHNVSHLAVGCTVHDALETKPPLPLGESTTGDCAPVVQRCSGAYVEHSAVALEYLAPVIRYRHHVLGQERN